MTKLLEEAVKKIRNLPEAVQDEAAEILLLLVSKSEEPIALDDGTRKDVSEGRGQAERSQFAPDEPSRC